MFMKRIILYSLFVCLLSFGVTENVFAENPHNQIWQIHAPLNDDQKAISHKWILTDSKQIEEVTSSISIDKNIIELSFRLEDLHKVKPIVFVTFPSGKVKDFSLTYDVASDGFMIRQKDINFSFEAWDKGKYTVELLDFRWLPVLKKDIFIAEEHEVARRPVVQNISINQLRQENGFETLEHDKTLQDIALRKAQDMRDNQYIGHNSLQGKSILSFMQENDEVSMRIGENVAWWRNVNFQILQKELLNSPAHRANILHPIWRKFGMAEVRSGDNYYVVQVFSD